MMFSLSERLGEARNKGELHLEIDKTYCSALVSCILPSENHDVAFQIG